jgi:hypothetical protein
MSEVNQLRKSPKSIPKTFQNVSTYFYSIVLWLVGSLIYLANIREEWWIFRDDSVIHISAARNLALFGSVGLSAGDRVESISSPMNFFISLIAYLINPNLQYQTYLNLFLKISLCAVALSVNFALIKGLDSPKRNLFTVMILNSFLFLFTISSWTTFGWIISGMENVLIVLFSALLIGSVFGKKQSYFLAIISISLLGVSRVELAALLCPLLILIAKNLEFSNRRRFFFVSATIIFWLLVHSVRFWYFGHLLPNTATALGKSLPLNLALFILAEFIILVAIQFNRLRSILNKKYVFVPLIMLILGIGLWRIVVSEYTYVYQLALATSFMGIVALLLILVHKSKLNFECRFLIFLLMIPLNHFFLFGPARLSAFRIVSAFVLPILIIATIAFNTYLINLLKVKWILFLLFPMAVLLPFLVSKIDHTRNLCCSITPSENIIGLQAKKVFFDEFGRSPDPIVANPDLGKVSFSKNLVNVDLGLIGEPVLAKIVRKSPVLVNEYLIDYVSPDILELHGHWSCIYSSFISDQRFKSEWKIAWTGYVSDEMSNLNMTNCPRSGAYTIWKRDIPKPERALSTSIATEPFSVFSELIRSEVRKCSQSASGCQHVTRAIVRNRALLLDDQQLVQTVKLLAGSPSYKYDYLRIIQPRNWDKQAYEYVISLMNSKS